MSHQVPLTHPQIWPGLVMAGGALRAAQRAPRMHSPFTPLLATTQGEWALRQSTHWETGQTHKTGPYTSGETGEVGLTATFSSGSSASCCPRPSSSAWECFSSALSGKAGGLRTCSLASNKEATVLELVGSEGLSLKNCGGDKEGSPRETSLPYSLIPLPPSLFYCHLK